LGFASDCTLIGYPSAPDGEDMAMTESGRLARRARDVAIFVTVTGLAVDALLLATDLVNGSSAARVGGRFLDAWGFATALLAAVGLAVMAWWARSVGWGIFAGVFTLIAVQDGLSWHSRLGSRLARLIDLTGLTHLVAASASAWGSFLLLSVVALVGAVATLLARQSHPSLRRPAAVFGVLLAALFFFAAVVNLWGSARPDLPLAWVEELGEAVVLSLALGYVSGLVALGRGGQRRRVTPRPAGGSAATPRRR
jgi:hypothetical protein